MNSADVAFYLHDNILDDSGRQTPMGPYVCRISRVVLAGGQSGHLDSGRKSF